MINKVTKEDLYVWMGHRVPTSEDLRNEQELRELLY